MTLLTEEEAKAKWCPLDKGSYSERHIGGPKPYCIGSACMAWRWAKVRERHNPSSVAARDDIGFCGAFGKPIAHYPLEDDPV